MMLYKKMKAMFHSADGDMYFFDIVADVSQGNTLVTFLFIKECSQIVYSDR